MAGAPISGSLIERFDRILTPKSKIHTPYGATEALPVATIERKEILEETLKKISARIRNLRWSHGS